MTTSQYSHLFELAPGEESVLVDVEPPEGLLDPVQPGPRLLVLRPRPPVLRPRGQAAQEAVLKTDILGCHEHADLVKYTTPFWLRQELK